MYVLVFLAAISVTARLDKFILHFFEQVFLPSWKNLNMVSLVDVKYFLWFSIKESKCIGRTYQVLKCKRSWRTPYVKTDQVPGSGVRERVDAINRISFSHI